MIKGRRIVVGITGGIAAYKAAEFVRLLVKSEACVHVVMTRNACRFVTPLTFQTLSGNPVATEQFRLLEKSEIAHVALADLAELIVIMPATANIIGKIAAGVADDFLSTMVLASKAPLLIVPSMNVNMWESKAVQHNIGLLQARGCHFVDPGTGELACHWYGKGRLADLDEVLEKAKDLLTHKDLVGERIIVTAGPTQEPLDPVRFITNRSSGKMGFAVALAARRRGAEVKLITGPTSLSLPRRDIETFAVQTAEEMKNAVLSYLENSTALIKAAAVSDYRPKVISEKKLKKGDRYSFLELEQTTDILAEVGKRKGNRILVGFAAETDEPVANARRKLVEKNLDLIVVNDVTEPGAGFSSDTNKVKFIYRTGEVKDIPLMTKEDLAYLILDEVLKIRTEQTVRQ